MTKKPEEDDNIEPTPYKGRQVLDAQAAPVEDELAPIEEDLEVEAPSKEVKFGKDHDWQKRYNDLRTHMNTTQEQHKTELTEARAHSGDTLNLPTTPEEVENFKKEYPDVYRIMLTVAQSEATSQVEDVNRTLAGLKEEEENLVIKRAENELLALHPDWPELQTEEVFTTWLQAQPTSISDAIYENNTDAQWAARVIDLFKSDTGTKVKPKKSNKADAAAAVTTTRKGASEPEASEGKIWTQSEIARLNPVEFAKLEKDIDRAHKEGRIR